MEIADVLRPLLLALIDAAGRRLALLGVPVRDLLMHRHHQAPWRGLPDLDLVVDGRAADLVARLPAALLEAFGEPVGLTAQCH